MATMALASSEAQEGGFFRWWLDEIGAAMPGRALRRGRQPRHAFLLRRAGDAVEVFRRRGREAVRLGALELPPPLPAPIGEPAAAPALEPESRRLVDLLTHRKVPVVLVLEDDEGLLCTDLLPAGAEADLERIMPHRIDMLTPWVPGKALAGYRVLGRRQDGQIEVLVGAAPRAKVDPTVRRLAAYGVVVDGVDLLREDGDPAGLNLLGRNGASRRGGRLWRTAGLLAALVAVAGGTLAALEIGRLHQLLAARERHAAALEQRLTDLPQLQARVEALRRDAAFVPEQQRQAPSPVVVLEVLSRILPDSIWLDSVSLEGDEITLSGYAEDAAQVLPIVESSAHFAEARFRAPSTRVAVPGQGGGTREVERFSLSAKVLPLPEPEP